MSTGKLPAFQFTPAGNELVVVDKATRRVIRIDPEDGRSIAPPVALPGQDVEDTAGDRPEASPLSLAVAFRPDGAAIVESPYSSHARQYDVRTGRPIGLPMNHGDTIDWLAYSPDGTTLASACPDGSVRLWDAPSGRPIGPALLHGLPALGLFFSPDSARLNVVTIDGRATSWPVPRPVAALEPNLLRLWIETVSGLRSGEGDEFVELPLADWRSGRDRLQRLWPEAVPGPDGREVLARWHQDRADDARRLGDTLAYRDHLDQLAALHPGDWVATARRAASFADVGQLALANIEYGTAARLAPPDELTSWYWSQAAEHLTGSVGRSPFSRVDVAAWYLDKVAAARPDDWRVHAHRAEAFEGLGWLGDAAIEQERATQLGADPAYLADVAGERAIRGEWPKAAEYSAIAAARGATDDGNRAVICLMNGDRAGYRRACAALLAPIAAGPVRRDVAIEAAWAIGLAPAPSMTTPGRSSSPPKPPRPWTR